MAETVSNYKSAFAKVEDIIKKLEEISSFETPPTEG